MMQTSERTLSKSTKLIQMTTSLWTCEAGWIVINARSWCWGLWTWGGGRTLPRSQGFGRGRPIRSGTSRIRVTVLDVSWQRSCFWPVPGKCSREYSGEHPDTYSDRHWCRWGYNAQVTYFLEKNLKKPQRYLSLSHHLGEITITKEA